MISEFTKTNHTRTESQVYYSIAGKRDTVLLLLFLLVGLGTFSLKILQRRAKKKEINKNKVKKTAKKDRNIINTR